MIPSKHIKGKHMRHSRLDDPDYASLAWRRYKQVLAWMAAAAALAGLIAAFALSYWVPGATVFAMIGAALGVFLSILLTAALMGLVFLSAGTGHDESVENSLEHLEP
jgi:hypothetical protein